MMRNLQTPAGQTGVRTGQTVRPGQTGQGVRSGQTVRQGGDFGRLLQSQLRQSQTVQPGYDVQTDAARGAAEADQAAAIRQAMGLQPVSAYGTDRASGTAVGAVDAAFSGSGTAVGVSGGLDSLSGTAVSASGGTAERTGSTARQTVNFSKHALARVEARGIQLTDSLLDKLADSVERAQEKGAKNILAFDTTQAFIINIPYSRVITAISQEEMRENIFTNIDGAVLL